MVLWQIVGVGHGARSRNSSSPTLDITQGVQQTLDAVVERLLLLHRVVEHLSKAGEGRRWGVFKNARLLNISVIRLGSPKVSSSLLSFRT